MIFKFSSQQHQEECDDDEEREACEYKNKDLPVIPGIVGVERSNGEVTESTEDTWSVSSTSNHAECAENAWAWSTRSELTDSPCLLVR